jgi:tRNA threonylcarbamoyladenosine biosynthesis protein TsaB
LARGGYDDEMRHAERVFGVIDEVLSAANVARDRIDAIACDIGPGSFTGVRVGLASAKGMALGLKVPLAGVCGLEAMASAARPQAPDQHIVPVTDGKRGELFFAVYDREGEEVAPPRSIAATDFAAAMAELQLDCVLCGDVLHDIDLTGYARITADGAGLPDARYIAQLARRGLLAGPPPPLEDIAPVYGRAPDAIPQGAPGHGSRRSTARN